jgi:hypothetical protein
LPKEIHVNKTRGRRRKIPGALEREIESDESISDDDEDNILEDQNKIYHL